MRELTTTWYHATWPQSQKWKMQTNDHRGRSERRCKRRSRNMQTIVRPPPKRIEEGRICRHFRNMFWRGISKYPFRSMYSFSGVSGDAKFFEGDRERVRTRRRNLTAVSSTMLLFLLSTSPSSSWLPPESSLLLLSKDFLRGDD